MTDATRFTIACPSCDEQDTRPKGWNVCELCQCKFYVVDEDRVERADEGPVESQGTSADGEGGKTG